MITTALEFFIQNTVFADGVAQVVQYLLSQWKALSSSPVPHTHTHTHTHTQACVIIGQISVSWKVKGRLERWHVTSSHHVSL
jgi:hypothetical protein